MSLSHQQICVNLKIGNMHIKNSTCEKFLGFKLDNKLNFNEHLDGIIEKETLEPYLEFSLFFSFSWT